MKCTCNINNDKFTDKGRSKACMKHSPLQAMIEKSCNWFIHATMWFNIKRREW